MDKDTPKRPKPIEIRDNKGAIIYEPSEKHDLVKKYSQDAVEIGTTNPYENPILSWGETEGDSKKEEKAISPVHTGVDSKVEIIDDDNTVQYEIVPSRPKATLPVKYKNEDTISRHSVSNTLGRDDKHTTLTLPSDVNIKSSTLQHREGETLYEAIKRRTSSKNSSGCTTTCLVVSSTLQIFLILLCIGAFTFVIIMMWELRRVISEEIQPDLKKHVASNTD